METSPHLSFPGTCEEALHFYERVLGARILYISQYKDTPMAAQLPPDFADKVIHATIQVGNSRIMACDVPPDRYSVTHGSSMCVESHSAEEGEKTFKALMADGEVHMPFEKTFWSPGFGMGRDKYGIPWMVNTAQPQA